MKSAIAKLLKKFLKGVDEKEIENLIEIPPSPEMGDYAFPCFSLAAKFKKNPNQIALEIKKEIKKIPRGIEEIKVSGAYLNFFIDKKKIAENLIKNVLTKKSNFGKLNLGKGKKVMIEFPSPNTNKPLHLGHLRNMSIGESVSRIMEFFGNKVIRANLYNDRGIHICKSIVAYQNFGKNKSPEKIKPDHFVGNFYVKFNRESLKNKKFEEETQECLRQWEAGDKNTIDLWKKMNKWTYEGFNETYRLFKIKHDKIYYESELYDKGKKIILEGLKKKIFYKKSDGAIAIDLGKELGEKIVLRKDGTSLYITQDIYLAELKNKDYKLEKSIYVVGNEQDYHFNVLTEILERLNSSYSIQHLSYGMVNLPEGRMKSREGNVVDADDLILEVQKLVKKNLESRKKLPEKILESRSLIIALSAIKYFLLKVDLKKDMLFNPKESINFEGNTGPYLLYSYARASSIMKKVKTEKGKLKISDLEQKEIELVKKLSQFPEIVLDSYNNFNPSLIANYSYQLAQIFNEFYHTCPVIDSEKELFRVSLVKTFRQVLKSSLYLLGIDVMEEM